MKTFQIRSFVEGSKRDKTIKFLQFGTFHRKQLFGVGNSNGGVWATPCTAPPPLGNSGRPGSGGHFPPVLRMRIIGMKMLDFWGLNREGKIALFWTSSGEHYRNKSFIASKNSLTTHFLGLVPTPSWDAKIQYWNVKCVWRRKPLVYLL